MVKQDENFDRLLKEFLENEGKNFSNKDEAIEVFQRIQANVAENSKLDGSVMDIAYAIDDSDMNVVEKIHALRKLHEENKSALERAIDLKQNILDSKILEDIEQLVLADILVVNYIEAGLYQEAQKLYELMLMANPSDLLDIVDELTFVFVRLNRVDLMMEHIGCFEYEKSEATLLLLSIFSINQEKFDEAHYYMMKLKELNEYTGNMFKYGFTRIEEFIEGDLGDEKEDGQPKSFEIFFAARIAKYYLTNKYHYELLEKFYKADMESRQRLTVEGRLNISKEIMKKDSIFAGMEKQLNKFIDVELYNKEIIESYTEKELKKLEGIGERIIKKLKNNGVKFKEV